MPIENAAIWRPKIIGAEEEYKEALKIALKWWRFHSMLSNKTMSEVEKDEYIKCLKFVEKSQA